MANATDRIVRPTDCESLNTCREAGYASAHFSARRSSRDFGSLHAGRCRSALRLPPAFAARRMSGDAAAANAAAARRFVLAACSKNRTSIIDNSRCRWRVRREALNRRAAGMVTAFRCRRSAGDGSARRTIIRPYSGTTDTTATAAGMGIGADIKQVSVERKDLQTHTPRSHSMLIAAGRR